jgi:hypothetical protein
MPPDAFEVPFFRQGGGPAKTRFADGPRPEPLKRPLRAAQMLALAYQMDRLIETGLVRDRAEMARVTGFDDSRISQVMNLMWLAPDIQDALLLAEIGDGRDWVTAKELLPIARCPSWTEQRRRFAEFRHPGTLGAVRRRLLDHGSRQRVEDDDERGA